MLDHTTLELDQIVYAPDGTRCVIHDISWSEIDYQFVDQEYKSGDPVLRHMDVMTFCEWFTLEPKNISNEKE